MEGQSLPLEFLQERARLLELTVLKQRLASPERLDTLRPGGSENPDAGPAGWFQYCQELKGIHAAAHSSLAAVYAAKTEPSDSDQLEALIDRPVPVLLASRNAEGQRIRVHAHQKALVPLLMMCSLDHEIGVLVEGLVLLEATTDPSNLELAARAREAIGYRQLLLAWAVTSEGVGLPYSETADNPELPEHVKPWTPVDIGLIMIGHLKANQHNLSALIGLLPPSAGSGRTRPSWSALVVNEATDTGLPTSVVSRDRSLISIMARRIREARTQADLREKAGV